MIVNTSGVVISRRPLGEYDRLCSIFTEDLGKVPARFVGVNRPAGKMKALTEPGVWGEYRLHLSLRSEFAKAVGGRLVATFPGWRGDLGRLFDALACCEMLDRLTPGRSASPEKFRLICSTLAALEESPSPWLLPAFGLRLAEMLGIGLREKFLGRRRVWEALHDEEPAALVSVPFDAGAGEEALRLLDDHFAAHAGRRLRAFEFRERWPSADARGAIA
ncbi:MAG: DNA repair protein RecO [Elusimicrobia bacterium]|nr:DNA repair protein RecO [Elusimicrobiota bacterium]